MWLKEFLATALSNAFIYGIVAGLGYFAFVFVARYSALIIQSAGGEENLGFCVLGIAVLSGIAMAGIKNWSQFRN